MKIELNEEALVAAVFVAVIVSIAAILIALSVAVAETPSLPASRCAAPVSPLTAKRRP